MNRRNRLLTGLLVVQLVVAGIVFVPRLLPSQTSSAPLLGAVQATDIVSLAIQDMDNNSITLAKKDSTWAVPQFEDYSADSTKVVDFVTKLVGLKTDTLVATTAASYKRLQVADDAYVRKIDLQSTDGVTHTLYVGSASGGGATNVRLAGQDNVYLARGLSSFEAATDVASWIDTAYLSVPQDKILSATIENAQGKFEFAKDAANQWTLKGLTADDKFNPDSVATLLARLGSINMLQPLSKEAKPEYGLDKPSATVTAVVSDTASTKVYTLRIGTKDGDGNYPVISSESQYYVRVAGYTVDSFVTAKRDTFMVQPTPTPTAAAPITPPVEATPSPGATEPITPTSPITSTPPITSTAPITSTP
jgi:hypothetical protein